MITGQTYTHVSSRQIELFKSNGEYRYAGQMAALHGHGRQYGCHYGMRSTRDSAMAQFHAGFDEIENALVNGDSITKS